MNGLITNFGFVTNVFSSLALIRLNKFLFTYYDYPNLILTLFHLGFTLICLLICERLNIFKVKRIEALKMIPMALCFSIGLVFSNYSLKYNSIGTYQCLKSISTPIILIFSTCFYNRVYSFQIKMACVT